MKKIFLISSFIFSLSLILTSCTKKNLATEASATATPTAQASATPTATPTETPVVIDPTAPTVGSAIVFSAVTSTSMTLTWGAATDASTSQETLLYKLVSSTSNNLTDVSSAETNGTLVVDWTANLLTHPLTGLSTETNYYFAVIIKNGAGLKTLMTASKSTLCVGKMIYLANVSFGAFGGKAGGDTACNAQKPSGFTGTAKALIYDSSGGRRACSGADCTASNTGQLDWPITANTNYCNANYVHSMGTSNSVGFLTVTLSNSLSSTNTYTFTGLTSLFSGSSNNCSDWTVWANPNVANYGQANSTAVYFYYNGQAFCATSGSIYCVEQ